MKCPFTRSECLHRECPGWCLGRCFLEVFLQKMEDISLKIDTLCNLTSATVASQTVSGTSRPTAPFKPVELKAEKKAEPERVDGQQAEESSFRKHSSEPIRKSKSYIEILPQNHAGTVHGHPQKELVPPGDLAVPQPVNGSGTAETQDVEVALAPCAESSFNEASVSQPTGEPTEVSQPTGDSVSRPTITVDREPTLFTLSESSAAAPSEAAPTQVTTAELPPALTSVAMTEIAPESMPETAPTCVAEPIAESQALQETCETIEGQDVYGRKTEANLLSVFPVEKGIEVSIEEIEDAGEETESSTHPSSWIAIDAIETKGEAVLGIDFGTALSKVALKKDASTPATAVPLARITREVLHKAGLMDPFEGRNEYVEDSLIYFDQNEFVFCGALAKKLSLEAVDSGEDRPVIQNLKTLLVRGGANLKIHSDFFPSPESLDSQSVLSVYLAYLLRLTRHYVNKQGVKIAIDLDRTIRSFSIPTWIEERYKEDVKRLFRGAAAYAFYLERWLKDDLIKGLRVSDVRQALQEARAHRNEIEEALVGPIMTESTAAGHARLLGLAEENAVPQTVLIVNVGAGFTDFALFSVGKSEGSDGSLTVQMPCNGGVGTGLGAWDNALKTLVFNRVREIPAVRRRANEFRIFKARLELQAREIKEALMASEESLPVSVLPVLPDPLLVERSELEGSLPLKAALFGIRDGLRVFIKGAIKAVGIDRLDPQLTEILVTGGGAFLPSVLGSIREAVATLGPSYPAKVRADYVSPSYASIRNISDFYPLLAVSLGSTEKDYSDEGAVTEAAAAASAASATAILPEPASQAAGTEGSGRRRLT